MSGSNHISQDDLYLFGLQLLSEEEMATAHDHMLTCDDCRRQLAWVQGDLAAYAMTAESTPIPAGARERLMRSIAKEKRLRAGEALTESTVAIAPDASKTDNLEPWRKQASEPVITPRNNVFSFEDAPVKRRMGFAGWTGWAVAAAAIAAGGLNWQHSQDTQQQLTESRAELTQLNSEVAKSSIVMQTITDSSAKQVSLALPDSTKPKAMPEGHASYLGSRGSLVFVGRNITQLNGAKTYELWLIPTGKDAKPIPAGTFKPDSQGRVNLVLASLPKGVDVAVMGVTVEPDGGSEKPTMPIVLMGE
jgi:anti-sigma-K factor RskA